MLGNHHPRSPHCVDRHRAAYLARHPARERASRTG